MKQLFKTLKAASINKFEFIMFVIWFTLVIILIIHHTFIPLFF